jgi:hypothetical protein
MALTGAMHSNVRGYDLGVGQSEQGSRNTDIRQAVLQLYGEH